MKISIITPTYNRKHFLSDAIKSVLATQLQPLTDVAWEYIIYDDGSTDGTEKLFEFATDSRIKYIRNGKNNGQSFAKNEAVKMATGDYIFFLDSDDILLSRTLYNFASQAKKYPEAEWFTADFLRVDNSLRYVAGEDYFGWDFSTKQKMLEAIFNGEHFIQGNVFFKKQLFLEVGMFDSSMRMAEDLDLYIRFLKKAGLPKRGDFISHLHRNHTENISAGITSEKHKLDAERLRKKYS